MKIAFQFILFIVFNTYFLIAQPFIQWEKSIGGSHGDRAFCIEQTSAGGYIVGGISDSNDGDITGNHGSLDMWIACLSPTGTIQWQKALGGTNWDQANSIRETSDRGFIIAGFTSSINGDVTSTNGSFDYWIVKVDSIGIIQWQKSFGGSGNDQANAILQTFDGGYIIAGFTESNDSDVTGHHGNQDYWIIKIDSVGTMDWQKTLGGNIFDDALSIQQTNDSGFIIAGLTGSNNGDVTGNHGGIDYWIVKLNKAGSIESQKTFGGSGEDYATSIGLTSDGGYIVGGFSNSVDGNVTGNQGGFDFWIVKLDSTLNIQWQKSFGGSYNDVAFSIQQTIDEGYIVAGYSKSANGDVTINQGEADYWIVKLNNNGFMEWEKSLGGNFEEMAAAIQQTSDGGYIIAGHSYSTNGDVSGHIGSYDYWVVKLTALTNVTEIQKPIRNFQIFPNPFSNATTLTFQLSISVIVEVEIRNIKGHLIKKFPAKYFKEGKNEVTWDAKNNLGVKVDNGIYLITLHSDNFNETKTIELVGN